MIKLETKPLHACQVLIVDDDTVSQTILRTVLEDTVSCHVVANGDAALAFCHEQVPDLIVLDLHMPGKDGPTVCRELKAQTSTESIPIIFVTSSMDVATEDQCWEIGAADFIVKPITASTLLHRVKTHLQNKLRMELLESMTLYDQLTGLYNRLYLKYELPQLVGQLCRDKKPLSLILIDIDNFKNYNDTYGHLEGDQCLQRVAQQIKSCLGRPRDAVVRFGGEEFLVLVPDTELDGAVTVARKMVEATRSLNIPNDNGINGRVTISAGAAHCSYPTLRAQGISSALAVADKALYAAKAAGKDRVSVTQLSAESPA